MLRIAYVVNGCYVSFMGTEKSSRFEMIIPPGFMGTVDGWRRTKSDIPTRAEAVRRLVHLGVGAEPILLDMLRMMESLPQDDDLDRHIAAIRQLVRKGLSE